LVSITYDTRIRPTLQGSPVSLLVLCQAGIEG
jgi:hypothetical protein